MAKKIYMTSFKGGTGVSTCCAGLGLALAEAGDRTLVLDGDRYSACGLHIAGLGNMQTYTLEDYSKGACRAKQTLISHPKTGNLCFASALGLKDIKAAARAIDELDGLFDYILSDKLAPEKCDEAIIVTEPFPPSVRSADCCKCALNDGGIKDVSVIVNKLNGGQILDGEVMTAQEIAALLRLPLKAVIPEDLNLSSGKWKKSTFKAFKAAADNVTGRSEGVLNVTRQYFGVYGYVKRKVRERL